MAKDTAELVAYRALRAEAVALLAIPVSDARSASPELRALLERLIAVCDSQAGIAGAPSSLTYSDPSPATGYVLRVGDLEALIRRACLLAGQQWSRHVLPSEMWRFANAVAAVQGSQPCAARPTSRASTSTPWSPT